MISTLCFLSVSFSTQIHTHLIVVSTLFFNFIFRNLDISKTWLHIIRTFLTPGLQNGCIGCAQRHVARVAKASWNPALVPLFSLPVQFQDSVCSKGTRGAVRARGGLCECSPWWPHDTWREGWTIPSSCWYLNCFSLCCYKQDGGNCCLVTICAFILWFPWSK